MADTEETPAQRQARIRREKREAKIKGAGQDRLDKITRLSGRTPESMRDLSPAAPTPDTTSDATSSPLPATPTPAPTNDPGQVQAQQDFIREFLRNQNPGGQGQDGGVQEDDPMMKMLQSMMGQMNGDPNAPPMPSLNPDDISKATGLPSFVTNMMMGKPKEQPSPEQAREARTWTVVHVLFALLAGLYMVFTIDKLTTTFGVNPPAPATFQNPLALFVLGEGLLHSSRTVLSSTPGKTGFGFWFQTGKDLLRDALVMVFILGAHIWWQDFS